MFEGLLIVFECFLGVVRGVSTPLDGNLSEPYGRGSAFVLDSFLFGFASFDGNDFCGQQPMRHCHIAHLGGGSINLGNAGQQTSWYVYFDGQEIVDEIKPFRAMIKDALENYDAA